MQCAKAKMKAAAGLAAVAKLDSIVLNAIMNFAGSSVSNARS